MLNLFDQVVDRVQHIRANAVAKLRQVTVTTASIQTSVDVALQIVRQLPDGIFDSGFGDAKLLFEVCVLGAHFLNLMLGSLDLSIAFVYLAQRDVDQVLQTCDCGHRLFDQIELLRLQVIRPILGLFRDNLIVFLTDADHILLVLPQSLPNIVALLGRNSRRGGCLAFIRASSRTHARSHTRGCLLVWRLPAAGSSLLSTAGRSTIMLVLNACASLLFGRVLVVGCAPLCLTTPRHALHRRSVFLPGSTPAYMGVPTRDGLCRLLAIDCGTVAATALLLMLL